MEYKYFFVTSGGHHTQTQEMSAWLACNLQEGYNQDSTLVFCWIILLLPFLENKLLQDFQISKHYQIYLWSPFWVVQQRVEVFFLVGDDHILFCHILPQKPARCNPKNLSKWEIVYHFFFSFISWSIWQKWSISLFSKNWSHNLSTFSRLLLDELSPHHHSRSSWLNT